MDQERQDDIAARRLLDSESIRKFVVVAEELHFGRAAQRLGIAQPPLSRAIRQLERRLGAELLARTSRAVTLTEAGSVLLREGRAALDAVDAAGRRTRRAATGRSGLILAVPDAPTVTTVIAWPPDSQSRALAGLVRAATRL